MLSLLVGRLRVCRRHSWGRTSGELMLFFSLSVKNSVVCRSPALSSLFSEGFRRSCCAHLRGMPEGYHFISGCVLPYDDFFLQETSESGGAGELLQMSSGNLRVRSAAYYARLAQQDASETGESDFLSSAPSPRAQVARTQSLANWNSGPLAGTGKAYSSMPAQNCRPPFRPCHFPYLSCIPLCPQFL